MKCRHCETLLKHTFLDLGYAPPSNAYLSPKDLNRPEVFYPLNIKVCDECWLVQTEDYTDADALFTSEYAYFSSTSSGWLAHAKCYSEQMTEMLGLDGSSFVIEVASNDGYLLKNFFETGIPCMGIEPTDSTAEVAERLGIHVLREFFGEFLGKQLSMDGKRADLIVGNNVYAHVPDINDFTRGLKAALKPSGTITLEFPHLMNLIGLNQFDTVYHEHFSYLSLFTVNRIFKEAGLRVWNVEELPTHGGSLRVYGCHNDDPRATDASVDAILAEEAKRGLLELQTYLDFQPRADKIKDDLLAFLIEQKRKGAKVAAYGAAAKGNTLLNYAGVKPDLVSFVCDAAYAKQNKLMPGSHIPIMAPTLIAEAKPDFIVILPWNIAEEVENQLSFIRDWSGKFVRVIPEMHVW